MPVFDHSGQLSDATTAGATVWRRVHRQSQEEQIMSDNKSNRGEPDRSKINASEAYEVEYWSSKFGVTPQRLRDAVKTAGNSPAAVEKALQR